MSFGFRDQDRQSLRDRIRGKSGDQILEELRKKLDEDKEMFFERVPNPHSFRRAGFPFDDDGLRARGRPDLKHRLEELAERHPDLADSLRPWYDQPGAGDAGGASAFHQRRDTNPFPEPTPQQRQQQQQQPQRAEAAEQPQPAPGLAQHGLRNTVDLGEAQAQAQMEGEEERGKRAQSAPPAPDQQQPQRFVSRLDINPQPGEAARPPPAGPKASANAGNVRQIPIFVEGRDEPVLARDDVDSSAANFGQGFPPMHPHSGSFAHQGFARPHMGFPSFHSRDVHDQEAPAHKRPFAQQHHQPTPPPTRHHQQPSPQPQRQKTPPQPQQPKQQPKQQQQQPKPQPPPAQPQPPPPPPPQQQKPLDPLEKVRAVQQEVESLSKQVDEFTGTKRDKHYLFLDEMLTRELIKLDVIETEGRDDVRAARKEAIRCIQQCISRLEAKAGAENKEAMEAEPAPLAADEPMDTEPTPSASPSQPAGDNSKTEADSTSSPIPAPTPSTELVNPVPDAAVQTEETASAGLAVEATGSQSSLPSSQNMDISPPSSESVPTPAPSAPSPAGAGPVPGAEQAAPVT